MSVLDKIIKDVEKYYSNTEKNNYELVKDLRNKPLFTFDSMLKFTAMYIAEQANGDDKTSSDCVLHVVSGCSSCGCREYDYVEDGKVCAYCQEPL